jgi:cytochrome b561
MTMAERSGYSGLQIALHWLIALLIGVNYLVSEGMEESFDKMMEGGAVTGWTPAIHVYVGVAVLALVAIRLLVRLMLGAPAPAHGGTLLDKLGEWSHWVLYALMLVVPALGALSWYAMIDQTASLHVLTMNGMMILIGLHSAAALFHQFIMKDRLLLRMMKRG